MTTRRAAIVLLALALAGCESSFVVVFRGDGGQAADGFSDLATGDRHACAITMGRLMCWGDNTWLELGRDDVASSDVPTGAAVSLDDVVKVDAGERSTCVARASGELACFGTNDYGQLGVPDVSESAAPLTVPLPGPVSTFSVGHFTACAVLRDASLYCWGRNDEGTLGQGAEGEPSSTPLRVLSGVGVVEVSVGEAHACAIAIDGALYCWGRNSQGQVGLGEGTPARVYVPTQVGTARWRAVSAGQSHTCGIGEGGELYCWGLDEEGDGHAGPLGLEGSTPHGTPTRVGSASGWTSVRADHFHTCGLRGTALYCWGRNAEGQLGTGDRAVTQTPRLISDGNAEVDLGRLFTCARALDGVVRCAGSNSTGMLGSGTAEPNSGSIFVPVVPVR